MMAASARRKFYDLDSTPAARLGNFSTRRHVDTTDNGMIVGGSEPGKLLIEVTAPSLAIAGVH